MNRREKLLMLSGSLLIMHSLAGCDMQKVDSYFAPDRRVPDGSTVDFSNRHAPMMNPVEGKIGLRRVPAEENLGSSGLPAAVMAQSPAPMRGPVVGSSAAPSAIYPSTMKEPVVPVAAADVPPPSAAPAPVADNSAYPSLSSVPQTPQTPSGTNIKNNFGALSSQQKASDTERQALMNDPNATVMTSPQTGQAVTNPDVAAGAVPMLNDPTQQPFAAPAQPQQMAAQSAAAAPMDAQNAAAPAEPVVADKSDPGFVSWVHNLFSSDKKKQPEAPTAATSTTNADALNAATPMPAPTMEVRKAPLENAQVDTSPMPAGNAQPVAMNNGASDAAIQSSDVAPSLHYPTAGGSAPAPAEAQATAAYQPAPQPAPAPVAEAPRQPMDLMTPQANTSANAAPVMLPPVKVNEGAAPAQQSSGNGSWMNEQQAQNTGAKPAANATPAKNSAAAPVPPAATAADAGAPANANNPAAIEGNQLPDISQLTDEKPVKLTPPRDDASGAYINNSRYASQHQNDSFGNN
ncbi:MAG TPA: hypothetical protein VFT64_09815 [Rickettsiales bacterium]|nr:hypothetical protein [Rickettsiales bacterium]